jgi:voltage-gated potassium channel
VIRLILAALALTAVTVVLHGVLTAVAARSVRRRWLAPIARPGSLGAELLIARLVSTLLLLHLADAMVWALFFVLAGALPDVERAAYFSLTSYTTVGYGDILLPEPWRLLGPLEAAVGVLMLGWSTGILVAVIGMIHGRPLPSLATDDGPSTELRT